MLWFAIDLPQVDILRTAILAMLQQKKGVDFSPLEVIRQMYPENWEFFQEDIFHAAQELYQENLIEIRSQNLLVDAQTELPLNSKISKPTKLI